MSTVNLGEEDQDTRKMISDFGNSRGNSRYSYKLKIVENHLVINSIVGLKKQFNFSKNSFIFNRHNNAISFF